MQHKYDSLYFNNHTYYSISYRLDLCKNKISLKINSKKLLVLSFCYLLKYPSVTLNNTLLNINTVAE